MLAWKHDPKLEIEFLSWIDLRDQVMVGLTGYASTLLDEFDLTDTSATSRQSTSKLCFAPVTAQPLSRQFPEFVTLPDSLELWLRRMPKLALRLSQLSKGTFWYDGVNGKVRLVPERASDLSLEEAWEIEDAFQVDDRHRAQAGNLDHALGIHLPLFMGPLRGLFLRLRQFAVPLIGACLTLLFK